MNKCDHKFIVIDLTGIISHTYCKLCREYFPKPAVRQDYQVKYYKHKEAK